MFSTQIGIFICLLFWQTAISQQNEKGPIVETKLGKIEGAMLISQYGTSINAFRGIPYAQAPIGKLRFAAPQPITSWSGTLDGTVDSLICPQPNVAVDLVTEDCLKLNVSSRNLTGSAPVMVWLHGGGNAYGSGHSIYEAGPQYLLEHDVVLVALNYRLGALGFVSTRTKEAPGNYGYLDQILALKWVQEHIADFGGNPNLVTIFGLSAGSMAVSLHMASPLSKGLFHRAIAMSGSAANHYNVDNLYWTRKLAHETSCPMYNPQDVIDCLREVSWETIIAVCSTWEPYNFINMKWNYEIDGHFLEDHPTEVFRSGKYNAVPLLIGFTKNECDFAAHHQENNTGLLNDISLNFEKYAPEIFLYKDSVETQEVSRKIQKFYLGDSGKVTPDNLVDFGEIFSDTLGFPVRRLVDLLHSNVPVYYYRMDYLGERSFNVDNNGVPRGVGHGDDLQYLMPGLWYGPQFPIDHPDMFMVNRSTAWWTAFARTGNPYVEEYEISWTTFDKGTIYIDRQSHVAAPPYEERYALWSELFPLTKSSATTMQLKIYLGICIGVITILKVIY